MVKRTNDQTLAAICSRKEPVESGVDPEGDAGSQFQVLYKFSRPHTVRGTVLAFATGMLRVFIDNYDVLSSGGFLLDPWLWFKAFLGLLSLLLGNIYIVGINQVFDVKIDRINKPFLPIASGELSLHTAAILSIGFAVAGTMITLTLFSPIIFYLYTFGLLLGTLYSVPPIQFKKNAIAAGITIATVRGSLLNFGAFYATREALQLPFEWTPAALFLLIFNTIFAICIAVAKDLPDIEGDKKYEIATFAAKMGVKKMSLVVTLILLFDYLIAISFPFFYATRVFRTEIMVGTHLLFAASLSFKFWHLNPENATEVKRFYGFIWTLFYCEYLLFLFI